MKTKEEVLEDFKQKTAEHQTALKTFNELIEKNQYVDYCQSQAKHEKELLKDFEEKQRLINSIPDENWKSFYQLAKFILEDELTEIHNQIKDLEKRLNDHNF